MVCALRVAMYVLQVARRAFTRRALCINHCAFRFTISALHSARYALEICASSFMLCVLHFALCAFRVARCALRIALFVLLCSWRGTLLALCVAFFALHVERLRFARCALNAAICALRFERLNNKF